MKCLRKLRVPCDQHSSRAQTRSNLSISGLVAQRPTPTQDIYGEKTVSNNLTTTLYTAAYTDLEKKDINIYVTAHQSSRRNLFVK